MFRNHSCIKRDNESCSRTKSLRLKSTKLSRKSESKHFFKILTGIGSLHFGNLLRRTCGNYSASAVPSLGTEINDMIRSFDNIKVVFNNNDRVACVNKSMKHLNKTVNICGVEACCGFVKNIYRFSRCAL